MAELTRRRLFKKTAAGAMALGALGAVPAVAGAAGHPRTVEPEGHFVAATEPFVVYVRNPAAGEIVVLVGTEEIRYTDPELVARLWRARGAGRSTAAHAAASSVR
jgi:hypothetical protein